MNPSKLNNSTPIPDSAPIDFFAELSKITNIKTSPTISNASNESISGNGSGNQNENNNDNENDICLISKEKLHPNHITLSCNHKFNYIPIYKEVLYQKNKTNPQYEVTKLYQHQIKCPYCRTITNKLLPYIQYPSVNFSKNIHAFPPDCITTTKCSHVIKHRNKKNADTNCNKYALYYESENLLFCPTHYAMHSSKNNMTSTLTKCSAILKTGPNAGKPCNSSITIDGSKFCKRHSH
jgi:hypothetical protein